MAVSPSAAGVDEPQAWQPPDSDTPVQSWQPPSSDAPVKSWTPPSSDAPVSKQDSLRDQLMQSKLVSDASTLGELPSVLFTPSQETTERAAKQVATGTPEKVDALGSDVGPIIKPTTPQDIATLTGGSPTSRASRNLASAISTPGQVANSFATPEGALMFASPAAGAAFVAQMATSVPAQLGQAAGAYSAGDTETGDAALVQGLVTAGMLTLPAIHALKSGKTLEDIVGPQKADELRQAAQKPPTPNEIQNQNTASGQENVTGSNAGTTDIQSGLEANGTSAEPPAAEVPDQTLHEPAGQGAPASSPPEATSENQPVLQPALKDGDKILTGGGNKHDEIMLAHMNEMVPDAQGDFLMRNADNQVERGFVDQDGNFLTREEAAKTGVFGDKAANSENLPAYDPNATPSPLKVTPVAPDFHGGAQEDLPSDQQAKSVANNSPDAWAQMRAQVEAAKIQSPTAEAGVVTPKNAPEQSGLAAPVQSGENPTAMKYRKLDEERAQRGEEPLTRPKSVSDQETMSKAVDAIDKNPNLPDQLVEELNKKPRPISDVENHVLLLRKIDLRKQFQDAADEQSKAKSAGDEPAASSASVRVADLSDKLNNLENASNVSGSARGSALRSLRVMANEDYSLASLETKLRAAKGGAPLTDAERAGLVKTAADYKKANDELTKHLADRDKQIADLHVKSALDQIALDAKKGNAPATPKRAGLVETLKARADAARARINARPTQLSAFVDPTLLLKSLRDEIEIGAYHVARIGADVAKWTSKSLDAWKESMKKEFGDRIVPHLATILDAAKKTVDDLNRPPTHEEKVSAQSAKIKEKFAAGKKDEITSQVQKLARLFVERGITGRDALIDAVHNVLKESDPEITRRETMDAISGYGDFKQLSKDAISVKLRGLKGEMQQVAKLEDMREGIPPSKTGIERRTPTDEERKLIKAVNESKLKFQVPITDPLRQLKSALDTKKTQLENSIKDMQAKIDSGDFSKRPKRALVLDRKAQELTAQKESVAKKFKRLQRDYEQAQLPKASKTLDFISNLRRFSVLSGVNVLGKLGAYSATKLPTIGATEAIGGALSKIPKLSKIAAKAPSEGGLSLRALATATAKGLTKGFVDAYKTARTGQSDLRAAFSNRPESGREWYNFFQTIHEVIKSPLRRMAFELSLAKRMEFAASKGADITDPIVQLGLAKDAYLDSDRALLLENNRFANGIRVLLRNLEAKDKNTGQVPLGGKIAATVARVELPILSVPLNYVKQTLTSAFGLVSGSIKARAAFKNGIDKLSPQEADAILRHLKYGTIGGAALLYGFYDGYKNQGNGTLGGFYQPGEKRKDNQAGVGGVRVAGHNLPGLLFHNPVIAVAQLGHTMGAILASKLNKHSDQTHSIPVATVVSLMGLLNQSPLGNTVELVSQLSDPRGAEYAMGEHVKGLVVPQLVQEAANFSDTQNGKLTKRNPQSITQHIETGIPGLRQTVKKK
jgi:hypothetical protein